MGSGELVGPEDTWSLLQFEDAAQRFVDRCVPKTKLDCQLTDGDLGVGSGCCTDVTENLRCQFQWPASGFDSVEVLAPGEGHCHPAVDRR